MDKEKIKRMRIALNIAGLGLREVQIAKTIKIYQGLESNEDLTIKEVLLISEETEKEYAEKELWNETNNH